MTINYKLIKKFFDEKILNDYSNSSNSAYSCAFLNKFIKEKVLWTNPNPDLSFPTQTITLSSADYDYLECFYYNYSVSDYRQIQSVKVPKGYNFNLATTIFAASNLHYSSRVVTRDSDIRFTFGENKGIASYNPSKVITDNSWAVPIKIVGHKLV